MSKGKRIAKIVAEVLVGGGAGFYVAKLAADQMRPKDPAAAGASAGKKPSLNPTLAAGGVAGGGVYLLHKKRPMFAAGFGGGAAVKAGQEYAAYDIANKRAKDATAKPGMLQEVFSVAGEPGMVTVPQAVADFAAAAAQAMQTSGLNGGYRVENLDGPGYTVEGDYVQR